jgi:DNA-binding CsgD family transcriptional regulator
LCARTQVIPSIACPSGQPCPRAGENRAERAGAALIAQGKANGERVDDLAVSTRTIEQHIANTLSKLAFTDRAQLVRWAMDTGLVKSEEAAR